MADTLLNVSAVHSTWKKEVRSSARGGLVRSFLASGQPEASSRRASQSPTKPKRKSGSKQKKQPPAAEAGGDRDRRSRGAAAAGSGVPALYRERGAAGEAAWARTTAWREAHGAAGALSDAGAARRVAALKGLYPHYVHGRSAGGDVVLFELLGRLDTTALRDGGVGKEELVRHFVFAHEWIGARYDGEETRLTTVMDAGGLRWSEVNASFMKLLSAAAEVSESLVPLRTRRVLVVNAPRWFGAIFSSIKSILPRDVRDKVDVVPNGDQRNELVRLFGDAGRVPADYGGGGPRLGDHPDERAFLDAVDRLLEGAGGDDDVEFHDCAPSDDDVFHDCQAGCYGFFEDDDDDDEREDEDDEGSESGVVPAVVRTRILSESPAPSRAEAAWLKPAKKAVLLDGVVVHGACAPTQRSTPRLSLRADVFREMCERSGMAPGAAKPPPRPRESWLTSFLFGDA